MAKNTSNQIILIKRDDVLEKTEYRNNSPCGCGQNYSNGEYIVFGRGH